MASRKAKCVISGCCTGTTILIVILATTFKVQKETDVCLQYNTITRQINPQPMTVPGTKALGSFADILCYPKTVQKFEFSKSEGTILRTRTREGLSIGLDITIEYKFLTAKLKEIFYLTGGHPTPPKAAERLYRRLALRTIINVASQYPANMFLSEQRGNISSTMAEKVSETFVNYHSVVESLQMRNVVLDKSFVDAIDDILGEKLSQRKLEKERSSTLATAYKSRQVQTQQYVSSRQAQQIDLMKDISSAVSNRVQVNILVKQNYKKTLEEVESRHTNTISKKKGLVLDATISRVGRLQKAQNEAAVLAISMADLHSIKASDEKSRIVIANAESNEIIKSREADATRVRYEKGAEARHYDNLLATDIGMKKNDVLQHEFLASLGNVHQQAKLFVGYKKVPMFNEVGKESILIKQAP